MTIIERVTLVAVAGALLSGSPGCKKTAATAPADTTAGAPAAAKIDAGPPPVVGMEDPFVRLASDTTKSLNAGYKAMSAKKYDDARTAFAAVVAAHPDYTPARFQEVKAAALGGHAADVPALWRELLARDFVAYAGRLDKAKDLAPLRASPEWARVKAQEASVKLAYAADLAKGLLFVARARDVAMKPGAQSISKIDLAQEVYQVDVTAKRYRRLTDTEGRVFAFSLSPGNKALSFLVVAGIAEQSSATPRFADVSAGVVDLATLETTGPLRLGAPGSKVGAVVLAWSKDGDPVWITRAGPEPGEDETSYALDATRTAAVVVSLSGAVPGNRTTATPSLVTTSDEVADMVTISDDRKSLQIVDEDRTLRATRALDPTSVRWSPGGKRLIYAGAFDECKAAAAGAKADKNELYLWERGKKSAARLAASPAVFRGAWIDDDRLVYQAGAGKQSRIHVYQPATRSDMVLKSRAGSALWGFNAVVCPGAPADVAADDGASAEDDEYGSEE
jgi:hypothetical protein